MPIFVHSRELVHELRWSHRLATRLKRRQRARKQPERPRGSKRDKRFNEMLDGAIERDEEK